MQRKPAATEEAAATAAAAADGVYFSFNFLVHGQIRAEGERRRLNRVAARGEQGFVEATEVSVQCGAIRGSNGCSEPKDTQMPGVKGAN